MRCAGIVLGFSFFDMEDLCAIDHDIVVLPCVGTAFGFEGSGCRDQIIETMHTWIHWAENCLRLPCLVGRMQLLKRGE